MAEISPYAEQFRAVVLDDAGMTDGLNDAEAQVFIDWALKLAEQVGATVADDSDAETKQGSLTRFLAGIGRVVTRRHEHPEPEWATEKLRSQLEHSTVIGGPTLSEEQLATVTTTINDHALPNMEVLQRILAVYSPSEPIAASSPAPTDTTPANPLAQDEAVRGLRKITKKLGF
ncbi:MAG: hypothetical protein HY862_03885 [Chloroflexi bacterium]|nr:hypothetical protein [Chloroflexota bacterium]